MLRMVIDTNVALSGLLWRGPPFALVTLISQQPDVQMLTSPALLDELADVLTRPSPRKRLQLINKTSGEALSSYLRITTVLEPTPLPTPVCRDTDDDEVLALAAFAKADLIVSGDQDLLTLKAFEGIAILTVAQALERLEGRA